MDSSSADSYTSTTTPQDTFLGVVVIAIVCIMLIYKWIRDKNLKVANSNEFMNFMVNEYGLLVLLGTIGLSVIIYGFVFGNWLITLLITLGVLIITGSIFFVILNYKRKNKEKASVINKKTTKTKYKCQSCGGDVVKLTLFNKFEDVKTMYVCQYCKTDYEKDDFQQSDKK